MERSFHDSLATPPKKLGEILDLAAESFRADLAHFIASGEPTTRLLDHLDDHGKMNKLHCQCEKAVGLALLHIEGSFANIGDRVRE